MAIDIYLKVDGIKGECKVKGFEEQIDIESFSWGVSQPGAMGYGGGGGAGRASFADANFTATTSKAAPVLMKKCATGEHIKEALLTFRKAGGEKAVDFLKIKFKDILVTSYQLAGSPGGSDSLTMDQFSFDYSEIEVEYAEQKIDGTKGAVVPFNYNVKAAEAA